MYISSVFLYGLFLALTASSVQGKENGTIKAVYFMTNKAAGNSIVSLKVKGDGTLTDGAIIPTGGNGSVPLHYNATQPQVPDGSIGTGSVRVYGDILLVCNTGSDTVSVFKIDKNNPTQPTLIGTPVPTLGDYPNHIDYSRSLGLACVGHTGPRSGVTCFNFDEKTGLTNPSTFLPVTTPIGLPFGGLYNSNSQNYTVVTQTNPPMGVPFVFDNNETSIPALSDILFFPKAKPNYLIATILGTTGPSSGASGPAAIDGFHIGHTAAYPILNGTVTGPPIISAPNGTSFLFSALEIPGTKKLFAADAIHGGATLDVSSSGFVTSDSFSDIPNQNATCWVNHIPGTNTVILSDAFTNQVSEIDINTGEILQVLKLYNGNSGHTEIVAGSRNRVWALSPGYPAVNASQADSATSVTVFDVSGALGTAKQIQDFRPRGVGINAEAAGLAVWRT